MTTHLELSRRAAKDLRQLDRPTARRILAVLQRDLAAEPQPDNLDIKALQGAAPWLRLRVGTHRVLYRPLTPDELRSLSDTSETERSEAYLVARVIPRSDLDQAITTL